MRVRMLALAVFILPAAAFADQLPESDQRHAIRHTDLRYEMPEYASLEVWKQRAAFLRKQILHSAGLAPLPEKKSLNAQVFGRVQRKGCITEKVLLETYPGFFLGGNLYRPIARVGSYPGVVSPHGHWRYGRLAHRPVGSVPARAITLARQGYVVFIYDMVGYGDTVQLPHGFGDKREELWGVNVLGLQLWNSIRAVDFLSSLPYVDANRLAVTGASGGATQAFLLSAVDDRIGYAAPVNMISAIMQGGSVCENAANLRLNTFNVELAALMAPRPMLIVSATGDWTRNTPTDEFPAIRKIYALFGAEDELESVQFDSPHNYHQQSREAVYAFLGKKILGRQSSAGLKEGPFAVGRLSTMLSLWGRELPRRAVDLETFVADRMQEAKARIASLAPRDAESLSRARESFGERLAFSIMAAPPPTDELASDRLSSLPNGEVLVIGRRKQGDRIPAVILRPRRAKTSVAPTLIVHPEGTAWVMSSSESLDGFVRALLNRGGAVLGIDAFQTGRAMNTSEPPKQPNRRFFTTFNHTDSANRVQDVLTALTYLRTTLNSQQINLVGMGSAGVWTLFAAALAEGPVDLVADLDGFVADSDEEFERKFFIPGLRKAGDFRAAAVLLPPGRALLYHAAPSFPAEWFKASFEAAEAQENLEVRTGSLEEEELLERIAPRRSRRRR